MQSDPLQYCKQCALMLYESQQNFPKVQFLKRLAKVSNNEKWKKSSLFIYCIYSILHKFDFVQALQAIQKAQKIDEGSILSVAVCKIIRSLLYTYIDKHRDSLNLLKEAYTLLKSADTISLQMKDHYKRLIGVVINNLNLSNGKKSFFKFFNQVYDELSKQTNQNSLNEDILYAIHSKIKQLRGQIDEIPMVKLNSSSLSNRDKMFQKSRSGNKILTESAYEAETEYTGFNKGLTREEKSRKNIQKMINQKTQTGKFQVSSPKAALNNKISINKIQLKNTQNPYQLNLYADQQPPCQFM